MASRPVHLVMTGGKAQRQHMWEAVRALHTAKQPLTTYAVARQSNQDDEAVRTYLEALAKAGILALVKGLPKRNAEWTLAKDEGAEAPRVTKTGKRSQQGQGVESIWRSLRILGELSAAEASAHASVNGVVMSEEGARVYLQGLCNAGYVTRSGGTPGNPARYRLLPSRNTGPQHPVYQRNTYEQVFDPNLNQVVWSKGEVPNSCEVSGLRLEKARLEQLLAAMTEAAKPVIRLADRMVAQLHRGDAEQIAGMAAIQRFHDAQKEVRA